MATTEKLVRDKIPEHVKQKGEAETFRPATDDQEYQRLLLQKLLEEAEEFSGKLLEEAALAVKLKSAEELADVAEVLQAIQRLFRYDPEKVKSLQRQRGYREQELDKTLIALSRSFIERPHIDMFADLEELIQAIRERTLQVPVQTFQEILQWKHEENGGFDARIVLVRET